MRIAWFSHRYFPCVGGAERYSRAMVSRYVRDGHEAEVLTSDADDLRSFTDARRPRVAAPPCELVDGAVVRRFSARRFPGQRHLGRLLGRLPHWPSRCRWESFMPFLPGIEGVRGEFDAVFAVGFPFTVFPFAAYRTARACGAALVFTPFLHLSTTGDPLHRLYSRPHTRRLLREAGLVISPTKLETEVIGSWGVSPQRRMVLPMAVDHEAVTGGERSRFRDRLGLGATTPLVGQLGALDPDKGTTDLLRAVARLNEERPESEPIHLVLAGQMSPAVESVLREMGASKRAWIHSLGRIPDRDVPDFYAAIDVFAMPSRTDSFGIVYLEAWANRRPVIAAAAGGVVEVVHDGVDGLLVPFGDPPSLARAIDRVVGDPEFAQRLGETGASSPGCSGGWDERYTVFSERVAQAIKSRREGSGALRIRSTR